MASTLKINTLTGVSTAGSIAVTGEGNSTTTNLQQGLCKAWFKYSGSGASITDSLNGSSLTDNGTGDHTLSFSSNMGNTTYACSGGLDQVGYAVNVHFNTTAVDSLRVKTDRDGVGSANYVWDWTNCHALAHGDLA